MNPDSSQNNPAGRFVKIGCGEEAYRAFVPNPLPPEVALNPELVRALSEADRALGELSGLGRAISNSHLLIGPFIHREAVLSSRIEGTQTGITDLYAYEAGQLSLFGLKSSPPESDLREVRNYVRALEYGLERLETLPVSLRLMRELHERLMEGVRGERGTLGEFRRSQNWVGPSGCSIYEATFVPPPVQEMKKSLNALEEYLHADNSYPPLMRLALIHYQFEAIHPFLDGNGRIGRLLISLLLVHWNLLPLPLLYLSVFFENHRQEYYDLLLVTSERGAWCKWLSFFLRGVAEQSRDAINKSKRLQDLQMEWRQRLTGARSSTLLLSLVDKLFKSPLITIPLAQQVLDITYHSARNNINKLVKVGILSQLGQASYGKVYIADEIFKIITEGEVQQ